MKIVIIRHADPDYAHNTLTAKGFKEIECLSKYYSDDDFDHVYSSPLPRAYLTAKAVIKNKEIVLCDWLKEFEGKITVNNKIQVAWDLLPSTIDTEPDVLSPNFLNTNTFKNTNVESELNKVYSNFDAIIEKHGYKRNGLCYDVVRRNDETIVIFCHFGMMSVLCSRLFNVPYTNVAEHFICQPTGITYFVSEEREKGKAIFRMLEFGNIAHLTRENEKPSPAGRFEELYSDK